MRQRCSLNFVMQKLSDDESASEAANDNLDLLRTKVKDSLKTGS